MKIDLNKIPVPDSYWYMTSQEYSHGSQQMLADLNSLAKSGCISAAWALSVLEKLSNNTQTYELKTMTNHFCSRPIVDAPQVRILLNQEQLEAIVLLLDQALEMDSFTPGEINMTEADWIMSGLAYALQQISGKDLELKKYPGAYLPDDLPDAIEVIPASLPLWDAEDTAELFRVVRDNLHLAVSFGAVAIDRLTQGMEEAMTPQEWLENLFLEAIAFSENRETSQIDLLTAVAQAEYTRARAEYDRIPKLQPEKGADHLQLISVEV